MREACLPEKAQVAMLAIKLTSCLTRQGMLLLPNSVQQSVLASAQIARREKQSSAQCCMQVSHQACSHLECLCSPQSLQARQTRR